MMLICSNKQPVTDNLVKKTPFLVLKADYHLKVRYVACYDLWCCDTFLLSTSGQIFISRPDQYLLTNLFCCLIVPNFIFRYIRWFLELKLSETFFNLTLMNDYDRCSGFCPSRRTRAWSTSWPPPASSPAPPSSSPSPPPWRLLSSESRSLGCTGSRSSTPAGCCTSCFDEFVMTLLKRMEMDVDCKNKNGGWPIIFWICETYRSQAAGRP